MKQLLLIVVGRHFVCVDGMLSALEEHVHNDGAAVDVYGFGVRVTKEYFRSHVDKRTALKSDGTGELRVELGAKAKVGDLETGEVM